MRGRRLTLRSSLVHAGALLLLAPGVALALVHLGLLRSTPSDGAHLAAAAREIRLTFTEAVDVAMARVRLVGPSDSTVPITTLRHPADSATVVVARVNGPLEPGPYRIEWQVVGRDGHPVRGTVTYVVAPGATGLADPEAAGSVGAPGDSTPAIGHEATHHDPRSLPTGGGFDSESPGYVAIRSLQFTALLTVIGALAFGLIVLRSFERTRDDAATIAAMRARAATLGTWAAVMLLVTAMLRLYAQSLAMHGADDAFDGELVMTMIARTGWGSGWMLEVCATWIAIIGFLMARRGRSAGWALAAGAGVALAVAPALSGHAAGTPGLTLAAILADALHVIGAAGWVGCLLFVLVVGIPVAMRDAPERRATTIARLVNAFSPIALLFASVLVLTGVFAGWLHIGFSSALWTSDYGQLLLWKLAVLAAVMALGAWNWLRVRPRLGTDAATHRLRRSAATELALAAVIVIITAALVATPPPADSRRDDDGPNTLSSASREGVTERR